MHLGSYNILYYHHAFYTLFIEMAIPDGNHVKPARRSPERDMRFRGLFPILACTLSPPISGGVDTFPATHGRVGD